jgi:hypothetical protein
VQWAAAIAHAKCCTVQLGVYDRAAKTLKNVGSGAILEGGRVLTCAHNVLDVHHTPPPFVPLVTANCVVLIGVFTGETELARWAYTAKVLTPLAVLREMHEGQMLDLALLQITGAVTCDPPRCVGKDAVLAFPKPQIEVLSEVDVPSFVDVPCLRCAPHHDLRTGETKVTVIGFAALAGTCIFSSPDYVVNLADGFLQTRAFINTGSSGGPVINEAGDIVGVVVLGGGVDPGGGVAELAKTRGVHFLRADHG